MIDIIKCVPKMLEGEELMNEMRIAPTYDEAIRTKSTSERLIALNDIYNIFVPMSMGKHIYNKMYLSMLRGLQKKNDKLLHKQRVQNGKVIMNRDDAKKYQGMCSGDSFSIIGDSGIGKSSAISRTINMISQNGVIELEEPYCVVVPCIVVECPFDCSIKGMLIEILRKVDEAIGSNYYNSSIFRKSLTIDMLIGCVSQACLNHIGLLVVDEIQNVVNHKNGQSLIAMLTQLINNSSISICLVGTKASVDFFERVNYLSRRTMGLQFGPLEYDDEFKLFCDEVFKYQYVRKKCVLDEGLYNWLYLHSNGVCSTIISLFHDAQELAIVEGIEEISVLTLSMAYEERLKMLHSHIEEEAPKVRKTSSVKRKIPKLEDGSSVDTSEVSIELLSSMAKKEKCDVLSLLKGKVQYIEVEVN